MVKKLLIIILAFLLGLGVGKYTLPEKVITKEVEVIKEVEKVKYVENKHINTKIIETTFPDGKYVKETYIVDESVVFVDKIAEREKIKEIEKTIENQKPQWFLKGSTTLYPKIADVHTIEIDRRVVGPIFAGVYGRTDKELGVSIGFQF